MSAAVTRPVDQPQKRRRNLKLNVLLFVCLASLVVAAIVFQPLWMPFFATSDEARFAAERNERRFRASTGMAMPNQPDLARLPQRLSEHGLSEGAPVLMRIFKSEFELELWMQRDGRYHRFAIYPICTWSGALGPKLAEGDRQAPEGFYTVDKTALNPNSQWHLSFNLGYPNAFDRARGRTGSALMVHGGCASVGCFAMTNAQIEEIWRLINAAFAAGQQRFQVQIYPFRMSDERLARYATHPSLSFWQSLKQGYDAFEKTYQPPRVVVCRGDYRFRPGTSATTDTIVVDERCQAADRGA